MFVAQCKRAFGCIVEHILLITYRCVRVYRSQEVHAEQELKVIANGVRNGLACIYTCT